MKMIKKFRKLYDLLKFWINNPIIIKIFIVRTIKKPLLKKLKLKYLDPNYIFFEKFDNKSVIFDIGCGYEAELSQYLLNNYNIKAAFGVDPTKKHAKALKEIQDKYKNRFFHLEYALLDHDAEIDFFETAENESGSLLPEHKNILNDTISTYKVKTITIEKLLEICNTEKVALLKIDIEGLEYTLFDNIDLNLLKRFDQIFIEFHHISIKSYSRSDTKRIVKMLKKIGLYSFTYDSINYLFYW